MEKVRIQARFGGLLDLATWRGEIRDRNRTDQFLGLTTRLGLLNR